MHPADQGDTTTLPGTLEAAQANLAAVERGADAGGAGRAGGRQRLPLARGPEGPGRTGRGRRRIAEPKRAGVSRWHGDEEARRAVYNNRTRLRSGVAKEAFKLRAELVERCFALILDRGGMRRAWLRGRENVHKRYLVHVAGYNLGLIMRLLIGAGTPREFLARASAHLLLLTTADGAALVILIVATDTEAAMLVVSFEPEPHG